MHALKALKRIPRVQTCRTFIAPLRHFSTVNFAESFAENFGENLADYSTPVPEPPELIVPAEESLSIPEATFEFPEGFQSHILLSRCEDFSRSLGFTGNMEYTPWMATDVLQTMLIYTQEVTGCSWWMAITCCVFAIRVVTLPLQVASIRHQRWRSILAPEARRYIKGLTDARATGDRDAYKKAQVSYQNFTKKNGYVNFKGLFFLGLVQSPLFYLMSRAMRGFSTHPELFRVAHFQ
eukprot:Platyproteum_vivax@DN1518_c0_g1_i2.p1